MGVSYWLSWFKKKNFNAFAPIMTELVQFPSGPADFCDIHDFSNIVVFMDFGGHFKIPVAGTIFGPET